MARVKPRGPHYRELRRLVESSVRSFSRHDMAVYAMALAYRGLLALFPFAIFLVAVASFLRVDAVLGWLAEQGPPGLRDDDVPQLVSSLLEQVLGEDQGGLLSFGIVVAFWSVSMGARLLARALNAVLEVEETRPPWKRAAYSLIFAPGLALAGVTAVSLMLVTSRAIVWLASWVSLDGAFVPLWTLLRWPTALLLLVLVVAAVYRYAPDSDLSFRSVLPGALVAVVSWALASLAFSFVLGVFPDLGATYGSLGTAISLLLYLYFSAAVLLFGAELNAELGRATPKGGSD
ncbi:MAG: YihY/virulence factor BrkB family protein [Rubrobacter sp.]|nr:YihY/virulence factor BrkB family protein [Rubrobacter sp.]